VGGREESENQGVRQRGVDRQAEKVSKRSVKDGVWVVGGGGGKDRITSWSGFTIIPSRGKGENASRVASRKRSLWSKGK